MWASKVQKVRTRAESNSRWYTAIYDCIVFSELPIPVLVAQAAIIAFRDHLIYVHHIFRELNSFDHADAMAQKYWEMAHTHLPVIIHYRFPFVHHGKAARTTAQKHTHSQ
jgi:hypothetical protein